MTHQRRLLASLAFLIALALALGSGTSTAAVKKSSKKRTRTATTLTIAPSATTAASPVPGSTIFTAQVWADNWFSLYVNGKFVGEDSVPIATERSFNAETITFSASYPLTLAVEARDHKQTDSGLEYIGKPNQQMGDGGIIAQITDTSTGKIVAVTNAGWQTLVIHRAPLNTACEKDSDPDTTCRFASKPAPSGWTGVGFDDRTWTPATEWTEAAVGPKDGYNTITWSPSAKFVWGADLFTDNTVLLRAMVVRPG